MPSPTLYVIHEGQRYTLAVTHFAKGVPAYCGVGITCRELLARVVLLNLAIPGMHSTLSPYAAQTGGILFDEAGDATRCWRGSGGGPGRRHGGVDGWGVLGWNREPPGLKVTP